MKKIILTALMIIPCFLFGQVKNKNKTETSKFISEASITKIDYDWNLVAEFESGWGEYVKFYPITITNLKTSEKRKAIRVEMRIEKVIAGQKRNSIIFKNAHIDLDEVGEFITFLEQFIVPNIDAELKDKKTGIDYRFSSKEMFLELEIQKGNKRLNIAFKEDDAIDFDYYFWTQTHVDDIPKILIPLKGILKK